MFQNNSIHKSWVCVLIEGVLQERKSPPRCWFFRVMLTILFLQCLALDEDFAPAKLEEKVIRLTTLNTSSQFPDNTGLFGKRLPDFWGKDIRGVHKSDLVAV